MPPNRSSRSKSISENVDDVQTCSPPPPPLLAAPGTPRPRPGVGIDVIGNLTEFRPEGVVAPPGLGIGEDVVRLRDFLEASLCTRILIDIRVVGAGQLPVGPLDFIGLGVPPDAEGLVEVRGRHSQPEPLETMTAAGRRTASDVP